MVSLGIVQWLNHEIVLLTRCKVLLLLVLCAICEKVKSAHKMVTMLPQFLSKILVTM